jgi:hypothetical protein
MSGRPNSLHDEELAPCDEDGTTLRRLSVEWPDYLASHSTHQMPTRHRIHPPDEAGRVDTSSGTVAIAIDIAFTQP